MKLNHVESRLNHVVFVKDATPEQIARTKAMIGVLAHEMADRLPNLNGVDAKERVSMTGWNATVKTTEKVKFPEHWQAILWRFGNQAFNLATDVGGNCWIDVPVTVQDALAQWAKEKTKVIEAEMVKLTKEAEAKVTK